MPRHRVGDTYYSEEEYQARTDYQLGVFFFIAGALIAGMTMHFFVVDDSWPKYARFTATIVPALTAGGIASYFRNQILKLIGFIILFSILGGIIELIWKLV